MTSSSLRFNMILAFVILGSLAGITGCKTSDEKKAGKEAALLTFHLEVHPDGSPRSGAVPIYRANPVWINVQKEPALDPGFMASAELVDVEGGFALKIVFDSQGTFRFDNLTTSYKGHRLAVFARWTEQRWLGAPKINRRITDGVFIFTVDASREEAERIVQGLQNVIKKAKQPFIF